MEQAKAGDISVEQLLGLLQEIAPASAEGGAPWLWVATLECWALDCWPGCDGQVRSYRAGSSVVERPVKELIQRSEFGCLFRPEYEIRWRRMEPYGGGIFRTRAAGDLGALPERGHDLLQGKLPFTADASVERTFRLWGERSNFTGDDWVELRIPHRFRYPLPPKRYARLRATLVIDGRGALQYVRWREVSATQDP